MGAQPESSSRAGERERCRLAQYRYAAAALGDVDLSNQVDDYLAARSGGSRAHDWRKRLVSEDGVLLAKPHR